METHTLLEHDVALAARDLHRHNLLLEEAGSLRSLGLVLGRDRKLVLRWYQHAGLGQAPSATHVPSRPTMREVFYCHRYASATHLLLAAD
jgi:hypothetical protein